MIEHRFTTMMNRRELIRGGLTLAAGLCIASRLPQSIRAQQNAKPPKNFVEMVYNTL
jgi:hypothetical protein